LIDQLIEKGKQGGKQKLERTGDKRKKLTEVTIIKWLKSCSVL